MSKVIIGFGSNIYPHTNIEKAKEHLARHVQILAESRFVETIPIGCISKNNFINGAVLIETSLNPEALNVALKSIEAALGRKKGAPKFAPRTIDLDIVVWDNRIMHKDFFERDFLQNSVLELLPNLKF